ncbi:hypothetical protein M0R45_010022 [Rubus argutus]|uniref:Uncharacterized protein n=1 Tax=Rubus argutus TaxID=59490 RepID=A0AAW1Y5Q6_RUBAR
MAQKSRRYESEFIKKIVKVIEDKLSRTPLGVDPYLIGIDSRVYDINLWLQDGSTNVDILVIYGMRGIGKTTIAKCVYNSNFKRFEGSSFLENIREMSVQPNGLIQIQKQLLSDVLNRKKVKIYNVSEGITTIEGAICSRRVLLVLDDVDRRQQLDAIIRMQDRFCPGSKIIITTSVMGLLKAPQFAFKQQKVVALGYNESLELFSWHAFGQDRPTEIHLEHSVRIVHRCGGLPLALIVLGSALSGKSIVIWEDTLKKLEAIPEEEIVNKLRISFDSLQDDHDRKLFLHIACFFSGMDRDVIVRILEGCGFYPTVGIQNLIDRCLVTIDGYNKLQLHHLIRDMGRGIVCQESEEPRKRSRLWHTKDSFEVLTKKNGTEAIEGLILNMREYHEYTPQISNEVILETKAFERMHKLRLLQLSHVQLKGYYEGFLTELRWLCWNEFPFHSLPNDFPLGCLVVLEMCYSNLREVWQGAKYFPSLKILDLSHSHGIKETPDFSGVSILERLILKDCTNLVDVHESIGYLKKLVYLNVEDCKNLTRLPMLEFLETLSLSGCSNLIEFPVEILNIKSLKVFQADGVPIQQLWPRKNPEICWASCLPSNLMELSLTDCNLSDDDFPWDFGNLSSLRKLNLSCNPLTSLPGWIRGVVKLDELSLSQCTSLKSLVSLPSVGELIVNGCTSLETVTFQSVPTLPRIILDESICNLVELEYYFKLQPLERVDEEMIIILDLGMYWKSMETIMMDTIHVFKIGRKKKQPIQGLYEYGIFSTFLPGNKVPGRFAYISRRSRISFTVPLRPQISGLNIFSVYATDNIDITSSASSYSSTVPIVTIVRNKSKKLQWIYAPSFFGTTGDDGKDVIWLSHWKSGNQLEGGDEVTVSVSTTRSPDLEVKMFGVQIVYNEQEDRMKNVYSSFLEAQSQTFNRSPFSPFEISTGNFSSSDGIMEESYSTYYLHCRPEGLRNPELERLQWFHDLTSGFHERSIVYWEDDDRTPPDGPEYMNSSPRARGCPVRVKYFFFSLPLVRGCLRSVDRLRYGRGISIARARLLARWRDCYQGCCGC